MWLKEMLATDLEAEWDVWIEPQFYLREPSESAESGGKLYKPDLVVTKGQNIAGFFELKFSPQQYSSRRNISAAESDIDKLLVYRSFYSDLPKEVEEDIVSYKIDKRGDGFLLNLDPRLGSYSYKYVYIRTLDTVFGFFGIARYGKPEDREGLDAYIQSRLLRTDVLLKIWG